MFLLLEFYPTINFLMEPHEKKERQKEKEIQEDFDKVQQLDPKQK